VPDFVGEVVTVRLGVTLGVTDGVAVFVGEIVDVREDPRDGVRV